MVSTFFENLSYREEPRYVYILLLLVRILWMFAVGSPDRNTAYLLNSYPLLRPIHIKCMTLLIYL